MQATKPVPDRIRNGLFAAVLLAMAGVLPAPGWSQTPYPNPQVLGYEPSARSAAMGHTGTAVFWGAFPEFYWNPALLGHHRGIRYEWSSTQLVPDLADDIFFRASRLTLGEWGLGITLSGEPIHNAGGTYFDHGESELTDYSGQVIGTFESWEEVNTWGFGVNGIELAEHWFARHSSDRDPLSRFGDVSFGYASKDVEVFLLPAIPPFPEASDRITTHDIGYLVRLTPYDSIDHEGLWSSFDRAIAPFASGLRVDLTYGNAKLNDEGETINLGFDEDEPDPVPRIENRGYALRVSLGLPSAAKAELEAGDASWLVAALSPMLSVGYAWDQQQATFQSGGERLEGPEYHDHGVEVTFCNIFSIRSGEYDTGEGTNSTWGYGLGFHMPGLGGVYFDRGRVSAGDFGDDEPTAFGFWVDPIGLVRASRAGPLVQP